jgi:Na+/melibiose symporter-like transporter
MIFSALGMSSTILAQSMIADVVEDSERRTGRRAEGLFFSAGALISKGISGAGVLSAGLILSYVGFPLHAKPGQIPPGMLDSLAMTYVPVCAVLYAIGLLCMSQYKITRSTHEQNLTALGEPIDAAPGRTATRGSSPSRIGLLARKPAQP